MEITEEEFLPDEASPADDLLKEAWPIPPEEFAKEYEEYLMEIGVRF